jgi:hypothetical protein
MKPVQFTQYLRPDGRPRATSFEVPDEVADLAAHVISKGYRFESEVLMTGHVSLAVCGPSLEEPGETDDIAIELVNNGPDVPPAVERLIREAHKLVTKLVTEAS